MPKNHNSSNFIKKLVGSVLKEEDNWAQTAPISRGVNPQPQRKIESFSLDKLKTLKSTDEIVNYLHNSGLKELGFGSSRVSYDLGNNTVLKIAHNSSGVVQNKNEIDICSADPQQRFFTKIFQSDPNGLWLIVEKAEEFDDDKFKQTTGIDWDLFINGLRGSFSYKGKTPEDTQKFLNAASHLQNNSQFFKLLTNIIKSCGYAPGDIAKPSSWGFANNRPVIIDSGLKESIIKSYHQLLK